MDCCGFDTTDCCCCCELNTCTSLLSVTEGTAGVELINGWFGKGADVEIWLDMAFDVDKLETVSKSVVRAPVPEIVSMGFGLDVLPNVLLLLLFGVWSPLTAEPKEGPVTSVGTDGT